MPAVIGAFEFDHDQSAGMIQRQQVYPAPGILEEAILFSDHEQVVTEHLDRLTEHALQVLSLANTCGSKAGALHGFKAIRAVTV